MKLGVMNHPARDPIQEIRWIGENDFDFVDLTLEPTRAYALDIDVEGIQKTLKECKVDIVGHTSPFLAIASPFPNLRRASYEELMRCLEIFARLKARKMSVHLDHKMVCFLPEDQLIENNIEVLSKLAQKARDYGIKILVEHFGGVFSKSIGISKVLDAIPQIGFNLDVGHANLFTGRNQTREFLRLFSDRLEHVHISDNKGGEEDLHLPIGAGNINWKEIIRLLKKYQYDDTITLEIFSHDRDYLLMSRDKVRQLWTS